MARIHLHVESLKKNEEVVEKLGDRVIGRVALFDVINPKDGKVIVEASFQNGKN